jgi:O-antigen ligase
LISLEKVSRFLILAFPIVIISVKILGPLIYVLLALIGIYRMIEKRVSPFSIPELKLFSWITFGYFLVMVFSVVLSSEPTNDWVHLSRKAQFLIAPLVGIALYYTNVSFKRLVLSVKIGTVTIGMIVLIQYIIGGYGVRLSGMFNPNTFGDIAVILTLFSIVCIEKETQREFALSLVATGLGSIAIAMSSSRASILTFFVMLCIYIFIIYKANMLQKKRSWIMIFVAILFFMGAVAATGVATQRISIVENEIKMWKSGSNSTGSVAVRLEMYRSGLRAFQNAPVVGYGYRNANLVASKYAAKEAQYDIANRYTHLHNEYITNMVSAGSIGLLALLILFMMPLRVFMKKLLVKSLSSLGLMGIILVFGYMLLGVVHGMFEWEYENSFYLFFLAFSIIHLHILEGARGKRS